MPKPVYCFAVLVILISACSKTVGNHSVEERQRLSLIHSHLAIEFILNQNIDVALGEAQEALRLDPKGVESNHAMARVQQSLKHHQKTLHYYRQALKTDPDSVIVLNDFGQYLCQQGQHDQAMEQYRRAGRQSMSSLRMVSYTRAAACSIKHREFSEASRYLQRALEINPDSLPVLFNLAQISYIRQDFRNAGRYLERYFELAQTPSIEAKRLAEKMKTEY